MRAAVAGAVLDPGGTPGAGRPADGTVRLHCCASGLGLSWLASAGIRALSIDLGRLPTGGLDAVTAWLERGGDLLLGVQPTDVPDALLSVDDLARRAIGVLRSLRLPGELLDQQVTLTPACGLAGWAQGAAFEALRRLHRAADQVAELLHE